MPGIDFQMLRQEITMQQVLELIDFQPVSRNGTQLRGPCPVHRSTSSRSRIFSVNLDAGRFRCHKCDSQGNPLELWEAIQKTGMYQASVDLCHALGRNVPWVYRW